MPTISARHSIATLALAVLLSAGNALAADSLFTLAGSTDSGPLSSQSFSGSFAYDASSATAGFTGVIPLSAFTLQFADQTYTLATADSAPEASFDGGQFLGLSYADEDGSDTDTRPHVGFTTFAGATYFSYVGAGGAAGFGDYSISAVPEPGSTLLLLVGLGGLSVAARQRRHRPAPVPVLP